MDKPTYSWSQDEEIYHGDFVTIEAALQDALDTLNDNGITGVQIGENDLVDTGALVDADDFCTYAQERLSDQIGEAGDDFLGGATQEQRAELNALLAAWVAKVESGSYWRVTRSEFHAFADYSLVTDQVKP